MTTALRLLTQFRSAYYTHRIRIMVSLGLHHLVVSWASVAHIDSSRTLRHRLGSRPKRSYADATVSLGLRNAIVKMAHGAPGR